MATRTDPATLPAAPPRIPLPTTVPWLWMLGAVLVSALPLIAAWWHQPAGTLFTGFLSDRDQDAWSYIAKMHQGYDGAWLYRNLYSDEPHTGAVGVFLYYLGLGHVARWTGLSLIAVYHGARLVGTALFVDGLWRLVGRLWPDGRQRHLAMAVVLGAGGLGWLSEINTVWGYPQLWPGWLFPADLVWTGLTTIGTLLLYSHYPLALWLILTVYRGAYDAELAGRWPWAAAAAAMALAIHHPYDIVPVAVTLALWLGRRTLQHGWRSFARLSLIGAASAVPVGYYFWLFTWHPMFSRWAGQNVCRSPHPAVYLLAFGGLLLLALPGLKRSDSQAPLWGLLGIWVVANAFLLYAPVSWQRLMMIGLPIVLALWATRGLLTLLARWPRQRRALLLASLALLVPGPLKLLTVGMTSHSYLPADEAACYAWLAAQAHDGGAILGGVITGNRAVALSGHPAVLGHWSETPGYSRLLGEVEAGFRRGFDPMWLTRHHVRWLVVGPREQVWSPSSPIDRSPVARFGAYTVWDLAPGS
jgi:hypothetical protein